MKNYGRTETDDKCHFEDVVGGLGVFEREGRKHGIESNEVSDSNSQRRDSDRSKNNSAESSSIGGIFRQLKELREFHLAQTEANENDLKKRLSSNEVHKKQILQGLKAIESKLEELGLSDEPS